MRRLFSILLYSFAFVSTAHAAEWARTYGGTGFDVARSVQQTADGGYIVTGETNSFGPGAYSYVWLLKLDISGNILWQKTFGTSLSLRPGGGGGQGEGGDVGYSVQQTSDGGYIVAGETSSFGVGWDAWLLRLDANGNIIWQKTYGGTEYDSVYSIQVTADGGYIAVGRTLSFVHGYLSWIFKLDANGDVVWQKAFGGHGVNSAASVQQTSDGGYIMAGTTGEAGAGDTDGWLVKLDTSGNVMWEKTYGVSVSDATNSVKPTADGGYIVAGFTNGFSLPAKSDAWLLKLDGGGSISWQKAYTGTGSQNAFAVEPTGDGGYVLAGTTNPTGSNIDALVVKVDASGNIIWQRAFGGADVDYAYDVKPTTDGGYIVAGYTRSFGAGGSDAWLLKLDANGAITGCSSMKASNVTAINASAAAGNVALDVLANFSSTTANSTVSPIDSTAVPQQQCYYATSDATVPTVAGWVLMMISILVGVLGAAMMRRESSVR